MILSYGEIKELNICPDCARRDVKIQTYPSLVKYFHDAELCGDCAQELVEHLGLSADVPVNAVETLHDPGCPRLMNLVSDPAYADQVEEVNIHPVDLPDDHPWMAGRRRTNS